MHNVHVNITQSNRAASSARTRICSLRDQLVRERHRRHFSQQWIAEQIGIARSTLADFERSPDKSASWIAFAYAHAVDFDVRFETTRDESIFPENPLLDGIPDWGEVT